VFFKPFFNIGKFFYFIEKLLYWINFLCAFFGHFGHPATFQTFPEFFVYCRPVPHLSASSVPHPRVDAQGDNSPGRYSHTDLNHGPDMDRHFSVVFHNEKAQREVIRYLAAKEVRCCGHRSHLALDPTADADATIDPHTLVDRCPPPQLSHSPVPQVCPTPAVPSPTAVTITGRRRVVGPSPRIPTLRPIPTAPRCDGAPPPTLSNSHPLPAHTSFPPFFRRRPSPLPRPPTPPPGAMGPFPRPPTRTAPWPSPRPTMDDVGVVSAMSMWDIVWTSKARSARFLGGGFTGK